MHTRSCPLDRTASSSLQSFKAILLAPRGHWDYPPCWPPRVWLSHICWMCSAYSCDIAQSCAVEYVYGRRLVYSGDILVLDVTVTTSRRLTSEVESRSLLVLLLRCSNPTRVFPARSWVLFTSPNRIRLITPQSIDWYKPPPCVCLHTSHQTKRWTCCGNHVFLLNLSINHSIRRTHSWRTIWTDQIDHDLDNVGQMR